MNSYDCHELMHANRYDSLRAFHAAERAGLTTSLRSDDSPAREHRMRSWLGRLSRRATAVSPSSAAARPTTAAR